MDFVGVHLPALNRYFRGFPYVVRHLSASSFLVSFDDVLFAVQIFKYENQVLSVAHVLSVAIECCGQLLSVPRVIASIPSGSSWLLLTSYLPGRFLTSDAVPSLFGPSFRFLDSFEANFSSPSIPLRSTFDYFYKLIESTLSTHKNYLDLFGRLPPRPPIDLPCFVHGDFAPQNFLIVQSVPRFSLVDWEYAGLGFLGFDRGWLLAVSSFGSFCDPSPYLRTANDFYFLRFGYFRMVARLLRRRAAQQLISNIVGRFADVEFIDDSLLRLHKLLVNFD